jgi:hypothetical protein
MPLFLAVSTEPDFAEIAMPAHSILNRHRNAAIGGDIVVIFSGSKLDMKPWTA